MIPSVTYVLVIVLAVQVEGQGVNLLLFPQFETFPVMNAHLQERLITLNDPHNRFKSAHVINRKQEGEFQHLSFKTGHMQLA